MIIFPKEKPGIEPIPQTNPIKPTEPEIIPDPGKTEPDHYIPEIEPNPIPEIEPLIMPEIEPEPTPGYDPDTEE